MPLDTPTSDANTCSPSLQAPPTQDALNDEEVELLAECETAIQAYERASLEAGRALRTIRRRHLYRATHSSFEAYVEACRRFDVRRAQQLIAAADTVDNLAESGISELPRNEAQARPLARLSATDRPAAWRQVLETHGGPTSKKNVQLIVDGMTGASEKKAEGDPTECWTIEARRELQRVPAAHRPALARIVAGAAEGHPSAEEVVEAAEGYASCVLEDDADSAPTLVGLAEGLTEQGGDETTCGTADAPILDLDILPELSSLEGEHLASGDGQAGFEPTLADELAHSPASKQKGYFLGASRHTPLLVSLPPKLVPARLRTDIPEDSRRLLVEIGELERAGGPVKNGDLMLDEIRAACRELGVKSKMQQTNESVDWARFTTNPITGCWHGCRSVFCYAADISARWFPQGFIPTLYPERLDHFRNARLPDVSALSHDEAWRQRSVFVVSMGDLFGEWVPSYYVEAVLEEVRRHPGLFAFFLTKRPECLADFDFPENAAVGLTLTGDEPHGRTPWDPKRRAAGYAKYAEALGRVRGAAFTWLSIEPFRGDVGDLTPFFAAGVQMVAVGGQSRTRFSPAMQPEVGWVESVRRQVRDAGASLFEKENLLVRPKEIPFPSACPTSECVGQSA